MTSLLLLVPLLAAETPLLHPRTTEGVAAGIGQLRGALQDCVSQSPGVESALVHLRLVVDPHGAVSTVESIAAGPDPGLEACMSEQLAGLRFAPGEQEMPVEVPISVQRSHTEQTARRK